MEDLVKQVRVSGVPVTLTADDGTALVAIVPMRDLDRLARLTEQEREARAVLQAMRAPFQGVPADEIERETERALAEIRAERRLQRERAKAVPASQ
jgi:hypothetical protein